VQRFRGGIVLKAHRLCVSLNSRLEINQEEGYRHEKLEEGAGGGRDVLYQVVHWDRACKRGHINRF